jgi:hypothetical protein
MARSEHPIEETVSERPVACSLGRADLATQASRWERLAARAMTGRTETADGLRIHFRPGAGVEDELRELVAVENDCCQWAAWAVQSTDGAVILEVRSRGAGVTALHTMFADFGPAQQAGDGQDPPDTL